jgi:hypothetical protein
MWRLSGYGLIVCRIPLTLVFCFPGLGCIAVGALLVIAGKSGR